jgi:hypothetical protein
MQNGIGHVLVQELDGADPYYDQQQAFDQLENSDENQDQ